MSSELIVSLTVLIALPGAILSALTIYDWIKDHRKKSN